MENGPRKASDVLLDLETKINTLLNIIKAQDLNIKVLSNKLNVVMETLSKQVVAAPIAPKFSAEAINTMPPSIFYNPNNNNNTLTIENDDTKLEAQAIPKGFRRTSRPETYAGDNAFLDQYPVKKEAPKYPPQVPGLMTKPAEVIVPDMKKVTALPTSPQAPVWQGEKQNTISIMQRVVDKNGKSVFLAEVEIIDMSTGNTVIKTKTNGTGKWMASLPVGPYRVFVRKRESLSKDKIEVAQDIQVDDSQSTMDLPLMLIK